MNGALTGSSISRGSVAAAIASWTIADRAAAGGGGEDLAGHDAAGQLDRLVKPQVLLLGGQRLVPAGVEASDHAVDGEGMDAVHERVGQPLTGVVGVHALDEAGVHGVGDLLVALAHADAELPPDEPEGGVADAVVTDAVELALMVVEVPG